MPTTGFFTDSTVCIGCKACEVACKEWNDVPHDGFTWTGMSYDNTATLGHSTWRHVKFVERVHDGVPGVGLLIRRLQALRARRVSRSLPHRRDRADRVRRRVRPARCLQRLRLLRRHLSLRRHRSAAGRRARVQVHVLLRPAEGGPAAGVRDGVSDRVDSVRRSRRTAATGRSPRSTTLRLRGITDAAIYDPRHTSVGGTHAIFLVRGDVTVQPAREPRGADRPVATGVAIGRHHEPDVARRDGRCVPGWLRDLLRWGWIAVGYASYLAVVSLTAPRFARARGPALVAAAVGWIAVLFRVGSALETPGFRVVVPLAVLLAGYWLSGRFFIQPMHEVEQWLSRVDETLLDRTGIRRWYDRAPTVVREAFELSYLLVYLVAAAGALSLVGSGHVEHLDRYWTTVLLAGFVAYRRAAVGSDAASANAPSRSRHTKSGTNPPAESLRAEPREHPGQHASERPCGGRTRGRACRGGRGARGGHAADRICGDDHRRDRARAVSLRCGFDSRRARGPFGVGADLRGQVLFCNIGVGSCSAMLQNET